MFPHAFVPGLTDLTPHQHCPQQQQSFDIYVITTPQNKANLTQISIYINKDNYEYQKHHHQRQQRRHQHMKKRNKRA